MRKYSFSQLLVISLGLLAASVAASGTPRQPSSVYKLLGVENVEVRSLDSSATGGQNAEWNLGLITSLSYFNHSFITKGSFHPVNYFYYPKCDYIMAISVGRRLGQKWFANFEIAYASIGFNRSYPEGFPQELLPDSVEAISSYVADYIVGGAAIGRDIATTGRLALRLRHAAIVGLVVGSREMHKIDGNPHYEGNGPLRFKPYLSTELRVSVAYHFGSRFSVEGSTGVGYNLVKPYPVHNGISMTTNSPLGFISSLGVRYKLTIL